jgi:hypothetical protein
MRSSTVATVNPNTSVALETGNPARERLHAPGKPLAMPKCVVADAIREFVCTYRGIHAEQGLFARYIGKPASKAPS